MYVFHAFAGGGADRIWPPVHWRIQRFVCFFHGGLHSPPVWCSILLTAASCYAGRGFPFTSQLAHTTQSLLCRCSAGAMVAAQQACVTPTRIRHPSCRGTPAAPSPASGPLLTKQFVCDALLSPLFTIEESTFADLQKTTKVKTPLKK